MTDFYSFSVPALTILCIAGAVIAVLQSFTLLFAFWRSRGSIEKKADLVFEAIVLAETLLLAVLMCRFNDGLNSGVIIHEAFTVHRSALCLALTLSAAAVCLISHRLKLWDIAAAAASALVLPAAERAPYIYFPAAFMLSLAILLLRAVLCGRTYYRDLRTNISSLSIKRAIDALHTGILFARRNGTILLVNRRMQKLLYSLTGEMPYRGKSFVDLRQCEAPGADAERLTLDDRLVYRFPNGKVWMFAYTELENCGGCIQTTASDVTELWNVTEKLRQQSALLEEQSESLRRTLSELELLRRDEELIRLRSSAHDLMGQRLSVLLRLLRESRKPSPEQLSAMADDLMGELRAKDESIGPEEELSRMTELYAGLGVKLSVDGTLPKDAERARLAVEIIREAVNNAVLHGFAENIYAAFLREENSFGVRVSNDGLPPAGPIEEGGGLGGMRRKLALIGGELRIDTQPGFSLLAVMPGGEEDT